MEKVLSRDGTPIAYYRGGTGAPLVLIHGTGGANAALGWKDVLPTLEQHFTVYAFDRRGYRESGDNPSYNFEREIEDIATVVKAIGESINLLGHSFGALCALEAALQIGDLNRLILYEPAIPLPGLPIYPEGVVDQLQGLLDAGNREAVLTTLYREVVMMPAHEIEQLRSSPSWPARVAAAHTVPREARAEEGYVFDTARFKMLKTPTRLLLGGESPKLLKASTEKLAAALPNSQIV